MVSVPRGLVGAGLLPDRGPLPRQHRGGALEVEVPFPAPGENQGHDSGLTGARRRGATRAAADVLDGPQASSSGISATAADAGRWGSGGEDGGAACADAVG